MTTRMRAPSSGPTSDSELTYGRARMHDSMAGESPHSEERRQALGTDSLHGSWHLLPGTRGIAHWHADGARDIALPVARPKVVTGPTHSAREIFPDRAERVLKSHLPKGRQLDGRRCL